MKILKFSGYAAIFNIEDSGGDTILSTAFDDTLNSKLEIKSSSNQIVPLHWNHFGTNNIGKILTADPDNYGLLVSGFIRSKYDRYIQSVVNGRIKGLSIGYRTKKSFMKTKKRTLQVVDLFEVSVVTYPMHKSAMISSFKEMEVDDQDSRYQ